MLVRIEPIAEDPVGAEIGGNFEGEANSDNDAIDEDERNREKFRGRSWTAHERAKIVHGGEGFGGKN